jgi:hypothetical protein
MVFPDAAQKLMRHVSSTGALLSLWSIAVPGQTLAHLPSSVHLDGDQVRTFWTLGGGFGWAWIHSGRVINNIHAGPATKSWMTDTICGGIALTTDEGTLLALPSSHKVIQWPGGTHPHSTFEG